MPSDPLLRVIVWQLIAVGLALSPLAHSWLAFIPMLIFYIVAVRALYSLGTLLDTCGYGIRAARVRLSPQALGLGYFGLALAIVIAGSLAANHPIYDFSAQTAAGLPEEHIVLDPGIGFGKTLRHNLELLAHAEDWLAFGRPVLMGLSMKSMFGQLLGLTTPERGCATQVATAMLWEKGLFWHRVHDVAATRQTLTLAAAFRDPAGACRD